MRERSTSASRYESPQSLLGAHSAARARCTVPLDAESEDDELDLSPEEVAALQYLERLQPPAPGRLSDQDIWDGPAHGIVPFAEDWAISDFKRYWVAKHGLSEDVVQRFIDGHNSGRPTALQGTYNALSAHVVSLFRNCAALKHFTHPHVHQAPSFFPSKELAYHAVRWRNFSKCVCTFRR